MSEKISDNTLQAALAGVFGISPEDVRQRLLRQFRGLVDDDGGDDDDTSNVDREWLAHVAPRLEGWVRRLEISELDFKNRVAAYLQTCQQKAPAVVGLLDKYAKQRVERSWGAVTNHFEYAMPDDLLSAERTDLAIEVDTSTAWWSAGADDVGLELPHLVAQCLREAGEFSVGAVEQLTPMFVDALQDGTAPLPGFVFQRHVDGIALWQWRSTEAETAEVSDAEADGSDELFFLSSTAPTASAELQQMGDLPLSERAAEGIPGLVAYLQSRATPLKVVMREIGVPLAIRAWRAFEQGDMAQAGLVVEALRALQAIDASNSQARKEVSQGS